jgi:magnesium transporter
VGELRSFLGRHESHADRGPDYLFHLILDAMVDEYAPVLDNLEDILETLEVQIFNQPTQELLARLLQLKRAITVVRKTLVYEREILARLARGEFSLISAEETVYYRNVYDHVVRFTELIESSREMTSDLMQTHLSATSNRLNWIMKAFATISTLILPMSLVAGIYGMNFPNMPEIGWTLGYPFALGLMVLVGLTSYLVFRWKRWI